MAPRMMEMVIAAVVVTMLFAGASAQSSCTNALISMSPCLNYITGNSSSPSSSCCAQLATVVRSQPQCLCEVLNGGGSSLGLNINQTQALTLPGACTVQTPPVSRCKEGASPAASPTGTPNDSPKTSVPGGSKTVPSTDNTSDGSFVALPFSLLFFFLLFSSSYLSTLSSSF